MFRRLNKTIGFLMAAIVTATSIQMPVMAVSYDGTYSFAEKTKFSNDEEIVADLTTETDFITDETGEFQYTLNENGEATIEKYVGDHSDEWDGIVIVFPEMIDGYKVIELKGDLFDGSFVPECIIIESKIIEIPKNVFGIMVGNNIHEVELPDTVEKIDEGAFGSCIALTSINMPENLKEIEKSAFTNCFALGNITLPSGLKSIGDGAFSSVGSYSVYGEEFTYLDIPDGVTSIGEMAFCNSPYLAAVSIPESVTYIGEDCFKNDELLTIYGIAGSYAEEYARANNLVFKAEPMPSSINDILTRASAEGIRYVSTSVENRAIIDRGNVSKVELVIPNNIAGNKVVSIASACTKNYVMDFEDDSLVEKVIINADIKILPPYAFGYTLKLKEIALPESLTYIGGGVFTNTSITSINIPSNVEYIGAAFDGCSSLEEVELPLSLKKIDSGAFHGCALKKVTIPDGTEYIGGHAFQENKNLEEIYIPESVTYIGEDAFSLYDDEHNKYINDKLTIYGKKGSYAETYAKENNITFVADAEEEEDPQPETPEQPETPQNPENPQQPETPEHPEIPAQPETPEQPETPQKPETPQQPETPVNPEPPMQIITPSVPVNNELDKFSVERKSIEEVVAGLNINQVTYTGEAVFPKFTIKDGNTVLTEGTDYVVAYKNNVNAGENTAILTVMGSGLYKGEKDIPFTISPKSAKKLKANVSSVAVGTTVNNDNIDKVVTSVVDGSVKLIRDTDYTVDFSGADFSKKGITTLVIKGKGNYSADEIKVKVSVIDKGSKKLIGKVEVKDKQYTGKAVKILPDDIKVYGEDGDLLGITDFTVSAKNVTNVGCGTVTVKGKGEYTGVVTESVNIVTPEIPKPSVTLAKTALNYNGKLQKPTAKVKTTLNGKEITLKANKDYVLEYKNNLDAGEATVSVVGIGNYKGLIKDVSATFTINAIEIKKAKIKKNNNDLLNSTVEFNKHKLVKGYDYDITADENGKITVTGKRNFKNSVTK